MANEKRGVVGFYQVSDILYVILCHSLWMRLYARSIAVAIPNKLCNVVELSRVGHTERETIFRQCRSINQVLVFSFSSPLILYSKPVKTEHLARIISIRLATMRLNRCICIYMLIKYTNYDIVVSTMQPSFLLKHQDRCSDTRACRYCPDT